MFGFSKERTSNAEKFIFFHEDHSSKELSESLVGRKALSLFKLRDMDIPVPDFFAVSPTVYKEFLLHAFERKLDQLMKNVKNPDIKELEKLILNANFSDEFKEDLHRAYSRLSGFSDSWVAVRSSVVYPQSGNVSFSGLFKTELNVRGFDHLIEAIKHVYLSVFRDRVVLYGRDNEVDLTELQMAVVIQRMVQPEVSGVAYTLDPITKDKKRMSIEAVFGLGDVITDGSITPDQYVLEKKDLGVVEKHVAPQEWMKVRKPVSKNSKMVEEFEKIQISKAWSHQQKLEDGNIRNVAKIALLVEDRTKNPQNVEWVWEGGNVWVLQSKPILDLDQELALGKSQSSPKASESSDTQKAGQPVEDKKEESPFEVAVDIVKEEKLKQQAIRSSSLTQENFAADDAQNAVIQGNTEEAVEQMERDEKKAIQKLENLSNKIKSMASREDKKKDEERQKLEQEQDEKLGKLGLSPEEIKGKMEFLLTGIGASGGEVAGELKVISTPIDKDLVVTKKSILLIKGFTQEMEKHVMEAGGVLMDEGGLTSDVAILCREVGIPAVVGTGLASALLKEGQVVKLDGNVGSVYRVVEVDSPKTEKKAVAEKIKTKLEDEKSTTAEDSEVIQKRGKDAVKEVEEAIKTTLKPEQKYITATKVVMHPEAGEYSDKYKKLLPSVDGVTFVDLDELFVKDGRHPMAYVKDKKFTEYAKQFEEGLDKYTDLVDGNEVVVSIGSATVSRFKELTRGSGMEEKDVSDEAWGVQRYVANREMLKRSLSIIKKVRNTYKSRNLSLAIHSPMNGEMMQEIKKEISGLGLRRTGTFNIYAVLDKPSEIILLEEIMSAGIDGFIINTPRLARQMQGLPLYNDKAKYELEVGSVMKLIENVVSQLKGSGMKVVIVVEDSEKLVKRCVELGVYGVAVAPDFYGEAKKAVADQEAKMVMSIG